MHVTATPAKLRSGEWGARVQGTARKGDTATITAKSGKTWSATVAAVVWSGGGVTLVALEDRAGSTPARSPWTRMNSGRSAHACALCGSRARSVHLTTDLSGIVDYACGRCDDGAVSFA